MNYPAVRRWLIENISLEPSLLEGAGFDAFVAERLRAFGGGSESAYVATLESAPEEVEQLAAGIAVPETWFFRYPRSYGLLVDFLRRRLSAGRTSLRMASIGCATGEEPYSMAMATRHAGWSAGDIRIDAFDRNRSALRHARAGEYGPSSIRTEIPWWAVEYLCHTGPVVAAHSAIRELVRFEHADSLRPGVLTGYAFDVVFCRNLLIYLAEGARRQLLDAICDALTPGGLLFVGHAEPLLCGGRALRAVPAAHAFCLERTSDAPAGLDFAAIPAPVARPIRNVRRTGVTSGQPRLAAVVTAQTAPPPPKEPTIDDARDLADAGRAPESEAMVRAVIARQGPSAESLELLGMIRMASNDPVAAKGCFEQALYLDPARTACILQLAMILESAGDPRRAETMWNRARRVGAEKESRR